LGTILDYFFGIFNSLIIRIIGKLKTEGDWRSIRATNWISKL